MGKTLVFHSYKGGTGKTTVAANVAAICAKRGKKVCLLDFDFRAPSLYFLFGTKPAEGRWLNDFLNGKCGIEDTLLPVNCCEDGKLVTGLANPSSEAMWENSRKERKWWADSFRRLLEAKRRIAKDLGFDYLIIDTSPGIQDSSMNALAVSDLVTLVLKNDELDAEGTRELAEDFHKKLGRHTVMILNRVMFQRYEQATIEEENKLTERVREKFGFHVLGVIPCFCDLVIDGNRNLYSVKKPEHPFVQRLSKIVDRMLDES